MITHRHTPLLLALLAFAPLVNAAPAAESGLTAPASDAAEALVAKLRTTPAKVVLADGAEAPATARLVREWKNGVCRITLTNTGSTPLAIREVVAFDLPHGLPGDTPIFAEGFQKLSMNGGTLASPRDLGTFADRSHYKIPEPEGLRTAYGIFTAAPKNGRRLLLAATSCRRFVTRFSYDATRMRISFDGENLSLAPGATWTFEDFLAVAGPDREALFERLGREVAIRHPRLEHAIPAGWCSWACFGPGVTAKNVDDITNWIAKNEPRLKYIQIDDGYQPWMGDWLDTGKAFGGDVSAVLKTIRAKGLEPAIWVAPFVASPQSRLFREHPEWFVKDKDGKPLRSDSIGFGGWRLGPWYVLDGTHPGAQQHLTNTFRTLRRDWGVTYFKLDANYWGTMHGGFHHDANATRVEAYRRGMEAILKGSGDGFLLGCNHPLWPSLGLIHGSRSSMDVGASWGSFKKIGTENLYRVWQNGRFWWNDPDTALLREPGSTNVMGPDGVPVQTGKITENEYHYHLATIYASGGLILSGDDLTKETPAHVALLKKLLPPTGVAASFPNEKFEVGEVRLKDSTVYVLLNPGDKPARRVITLKGKCTLTDKLTDAPLGVHEGDYVVDPMPGRSGKLIEAKPVR